VLKVNRRNPGGPAFVPFEDRLLFRAGAYAKCLPGYGARDELGCGATLMTELDWCLHVCDTKATRRGVMRGRTDDRVVHMQS
jgi:hypothetical protein